MSYVKATLVLFVIILIMVGTAYMMVRLISILGERNQCKEYCYPAESLVEVNHCVCLEPTKMIEIEALNE